MDRRLLMRVLGTTALTSLGHLLLDNPAWANPQNGVVYQIAMQTPQYRLDSLSSLSNLPIMAPAATSLQVLGGLGMTYDTEVARIFRDVRGFRIYDGPSETHRWALARRLGQADNKAG